MGISREPTMDSNSARCVVCANPLAFEARFCMHCGAPRDGGEREEVGVADPLIGTVVNDRYSIVSLIGRGGMGVVYKVQHVHIGKFMAMKLLHGELARR
ncbi:MAG: serine/threonine protein kinase, partial [Myxococcales bacterium]|nr:serine/threonine protein kinase [Myxococcales bacterium]